ncbi:MAG: hypothetical protein ORN54_00650, partial [Cyclobacteriaceae bacterium]|nr:hypothetical protein [Cyclobacteriaceae bacterium]
IRFSELEAEISKLINHNHSAVKMVDETAPRYMIQHRCWIPNYEYSTTKRGALKKARKHLAWSQDDSHMPTLVIDQKKELVIYKVRHTTCQKGGVSQKGRVRVEKL